MAAPITHIVLTEKIFDNYFSSKEKSRFYIGTSFPDIRYMGVIDREKTHFKNLSLKDIVKEASFMAGVKFHSYLDEVRENFFVSKNAYDLMPQSPFVTQALKFLEDEILYDQIDYWDTFINYCGQILEEEKEFGLSEEDIRHWHEILKVTFSGKPTEESLIEFVRLIGKPPEMATEINKIVSECRNDQKIVDIIMELYSSFDSLVK